MVKQLIQKKIELFFDNKQVANIPVKTLVEDSPMYNRKWKKAKLPKKNKIKKDIYKKLNIFLKYKYVYVQKKSFKWELPSISHSSCILIIKSFLVNGCGVIAGV